MADNERTLPVPVVTETKPVPDPERARAREQAYQGASRGSQPHLRPGSLGSRKV